MRRLGSALGPGVRADRPGSCSPATGESVCLSVCWTGEVPGLPPVARLDH